MLHEFLTENREEIFKRTRQRVARRMAPLPTHEELSLGVPLFVDELIATLGGGGDRSAVMDQDATRHGEERQQMGFTVAQVVHDYGDLCQVVTQLAIELRAPIGTDEFKTLNGCLDDAIAQAVSEHARVRELSISGDETQRLGFFAHELRNSLHTAILAYDILKSGTVGIGGSTGAVLGRSLGDLQTLVDRTLAQLRLEAGEHSLERTELAHFLEEVEAAGSVVAKTHQVSLEVDRGPAGVYVMADRQLLGSALSNLLQNAFKFTKPNGHVCVRTTASADQVLIDVEDQCGGLKASFTERLAEDLRPFPGEQAGLGLGLLISRRAIDALGGSLSFRNLPGQGCVFTVSLPRLQHVRVA